MSRDSFLRYGGEVAAVASAGDARGVITPPSAVLIPTTLALPVPLYAVSSISLAQSYHLPPIGASGPRAMFRRLKPTTRSVSFTAKLPPWPAPLSCTV